MAINVKIALRVGSAMAWNMSCFIFQYLVAQLSGCKYICNFWVAQIYLHLFFFEVKCREVLVVVGGFVTMTPNGDGLSTWSNLKIVPRNRPLIAIMPKLTTSCHHIAKPPVSAWATV